MKQDNIKITIKATQMGLKFLKRRIMEVNKPFKNIYDILKEKC